MTLWRKNLFGMFFALLVTAGVACLASGCGGAAPPVMPVQPKPAPVANPAQVTWGFEPQGVRVVLRADPDLNALGETPLALSLCVYQLKQRDFFDSLAGSLDGVYQLMTCKVTDASMSAANHVFVQPGEEKIFTVDRAEGAKFLAVVAGFNETAPENAARVVSMPIHVNKGSWVPLFGSPTTYEAGIMDAFVNIAPHAVNLSGVERGQ